MLKDVGVNFKMTGADAFAGAMKNVQNSFEQLSRSMDRSPNVDKHFGQMAKAAHATAQSIQRSMALAKTAMMAALTAKGMGSGFDWALGSKDVSDAKSFLRASGMDDATMAAYSKQLDANRRKMITDKQDYWKAVREIDSAFANKPLDQRIGVAAIMPHYQKLLRMSQEESAQFIKQMDASFGQFLPADKQATFVSDLLGRIHAASTTTKVNANEIAQGATAVAPTYLQMERGLDDMISEMAYMIPSMGNTEKATTALRNIWTDAGKVYGKLAEEVTEANFRQRFMGKSPWKTMADLKFAANFQGNERAQEMLKTLKAHKEYFGETEQAEAGRILTQEKNIPKYMNTVGQLVDRLKAEGGDWMGKLGEIVGRENINGFLTLLKGYRSGMIAQTNKSIQVGGQQAMNSAENQGMKELWDKWGLVKQQAEDLSGDLKQMFEEPLIKIMGQWEASLKELRSIIGKDATGDIRNNISGFTTGLFGGLSKGLLGTDQSFSDWAKGQLGGMQSQGWDKTGESIGEKFGGAISTFASAAQKFAEIVSYLHSWLPQKADPKKTQSSTTSAVEEYGLKGALAWGGKKLLGVPGAIGGWLFGDQAKDSMWGNVATGAITGYGLGGTMGILPGAAVGASVGPLQNLASPANEGMWSILRGSAADILNTNREQSPSIVVQSSPTLENRTEVNIDGEKVAEVVTSKVWNKIEEKQASERDRSRQNALDGWMAR